MSVCEDSVSCPTENSVTVHLDSAFVPDAETVLKNTNVHSHVEEALNDSQLLKGLLTDTYCQVCEAVLMFESQRVSHYEGKKHAQRLRVYLQSKKAERRKQIRESSSFQSVGVDPDKFCELCNMVFSSPVVAKSHYEGKVHAKNTRKSSTTASADARTTVSSAALPVTAMEDTVDVRELGDVIEEQKESTASAAQEVNLSDPDKYCKLCAASFNNPVMAAEHYNGRKHQRNLARQELQNKQGEQSELANSLTCPLCHVTLSTSDTYQAHMKGNKHHINHSEKQVQDDVCQKKMYGSFQDELADYIQVQRSRGLEPKTGTRSKTQGQRQAEGEVDKSAECLDQPQILSLQSRPPASAFRTQRWRSPFQPHPKPAAFTGRFPVLNQWDQGYSSYPPPLIPGLTGRALRRGRSPESYSSSSSFSDSSTSSYSSTSSTEDCRDRRRRRKKIQEGVRRKREGEDSEEDVQEREKERKKREDGSVKKTKRPRGSSEEDHGKRRKERKHRERDPKKRRTEDEGGEWNRVPHGAMTKGDGEEEAQSEGLKEEKAKHKKEKKKVKDREDSRTEEEKLWDETILGVF